MHPPDELEHYLRGDTALSRQYRRESSPAPPHALDRRVLTLSRGDSRDASGRPPYLAPLAFAASVLLSVALVLAMVFGPQSAKKRDDAPRVVRAAVHADRKPHLYSSDPPRARAPAIWLADIAALRRSGRYSEADAELRRFRSAYPDYSAGGSGSGP
jgi:hypothetical protein